MTLYIPGKKVYELQFQPGTGGTINISWNFPSTISGLLQDEITGSVIYVSLKDAGSYTIAYPGITKLRLTVTYNLAAIPLPSVPSLATPLNTATGIPVNPYLAWTSSEYASAYHLQVALDTAFRYFVYNDSTLTENLKQINSLYSNTQYYWRVSAGNIAGASAYSAIWTFQTELGFSAPDAPILTAPLQNATDQPISVSLYWQQSSNASKYHVQLATDAAFSNPILDDSTVSLLSLSAGILRYGTQYYWRVSAINAAGQGAYSEIRTFTTILNPKNAEADFSLTVSDGAGGSKVLNFGLDPVATDSLDASLGEMELPPRPVQTVFDARFILASGKSSLRDYRFAVWPFVSKNEYIVQYQRGAGSTITLEWNLPAGALGKLQDLTTGELINVSMSGTGKYTISNPLTIDKLKMSMEYNFTPPPAVVLNSPSLGSVNQVRNPLLQWTAAARTDKYHVELSRDSLFTEVVFVDTMVTGTSSQITGLDYLTTYFWRVRGINFGGIGDWSIINHFTTIIQAPTLPVLASPANNISGLVTPIMLSWYKSFRADTYRIQVATDAEFTNLLNETSNIADSAFSLRGVQPLATYYWRVEANNIGGTSGFTSAYKFSTLGTPTTVTLLSPANNAVNQPTSNLAFTWTKAQDQMLKTVSHYWFDLATDTNKTAILTDTTLTDTSKIVNGLDNLTRYYWRVKAKNQTGWGNYSAWSSFSTIIERPATAVLISPVNTSVNQPTSLTLQWNAALRADRYRVELAKDSLFTNTVFTDTGTTNLTSTVSGLDYLTKYFWRIKGKNVGGESDWSVINSFTTIIEKPALPVLGSPANNATGVVQPVTLVWQKSLRADKYHVQVASDAAFTNIVSETSNLTDSILTLSTLQPLVTYYWRVEASDIGGTSGFTSAYKFSTLGTPTTVTLLSPVNNAVNQAINNLTFKWTKAQDPVLKTVSHYWFDLATDTNKTAILTDTTLTDTSKIVNGLDYLTRYYWRVKAKNQTGWGNYSAWYSFTTIIEPPATAVLISPANASVNQSISLTLQWNAASRAERYRIELAKDSLFSNIVYTDTGTTNLSAPVSGLDYLTKYFWRVKGKNVGGESDWSVINSFTTIIEKPALPVLASPANNATGVVQPVTLVWQKSLRADKYHVQVASDDAFTNIVSETSNLTDSTLTLSTLQPLATYYWRVEASNIGGTSGFTSAYKFSTLGTPTTVTLLSPVNNAVDQPISILTFIWNKAQDQMLKTVSHYWFDLATDTNKTAILTDTTLTDTSKIVNSLNYLTKYYWRVKAKNQSGWGGYSPWSSFTTIIERPATAALTSPANASVNQPISLTLQWNAALRADRYRVEVAKDSLFSNTIFTDTGTTNLSAAVNGLDYLAKYFWRVKGKNVGGESDWSVINSFTTIIEKPLLPVLASPANNATGVVQPVTLVWQKSLRADKYHVQVASDDAFTNIVSETSNLTDSTLTLSTLQPLVTYYWRVEASDIGGTSGFTSAYKFSTLGTPTTVTLLSPVNNAVNQAINNLTFKWTKAQDPVLKTVSHYWFDLATDTNKTAILTDTTLTDTSKIVNGLDYLTRYYWRVKAKNQTGWGNYSAWYSFTTIIEPPATAVLISPANASVNQSISLTLQWNAASRAERYRIELAKDSLFSNIVYTDTGTTNLSAPVSGLDYLTKYFWRIKGKNVGGESDWSVINSFTTIIEKPTLPVLASPANNATGVVQPITLVWQKSLRADKYHVQVASDDAFTNIVSETSNLTDSTLTLSTLQPLAIYYWRVESSNIGGTSGFTTAYKFSTLGTPTTVTLLSPVNNAVNQAINNLTFKWTKAQDPVLKTVSHYWFDLATDTNKTAILTDTTLTDTSKIVNSLNYLTKYYWRVKAKNQSGWGGYSPWSSFTTIIERPATAVLISPVNTSVNQPISLTLQWNAATRAERYRVELAKDSLFSNIVYTDTGTTNLSAPVSGLDYLTKYFWRVKGKNVGGESDWSVINSFTTIIEKPALPVLASPANNATGVVQPVTLVWQKSVRADKYHVQVASDDAFTNIVSETSNLTDSTLTLSTLQPLATYYWRVEASNIGGTSGFTSSYKFSTLGIPTTVTLLSPANNAVNQPTSNLAFTWTKAQDQMMKTVSHYWFDLATDTNKTAILTDTTLTDTSKIVNGLDYLTRYYWRVKAKNQSGWGGYSPWSSFTTIIERPATVALTSPANASVNQPISLTLQWNASARAELYRVELAKDSLFTNTVFADTGTTNLSAPVSGLDYLTKYFWRVKGKNVGGESDWSVINSFTTIIEKPALPVLASPANNATGEVQPVTLVWQKSVRADKYHVQVASDVEFTNIVSESSNLTDSTLLVNTLQSMATYYWRVEANNIGGTSGFTTAYKFSTLGIPTTVTLLAPANSAVNQPISNLTFKWTKAQDQMLKTVSHYWFDLTADTNKATVITDTTLTDTSKIVNSLNYLTKYYWRVKAKNQSGWGGYSPWSSFTTIIERPATAVLISPVNTSVNQPISLTLQWNAATRAERYRVELAKDSLFSNIVYTDTGTTNLSAPVSGLDYLTKYFWRVKGKNVGGESDWSVINSFTTIIEKPALPVLASPANNATGVVQPVTLVWQKSVRADQYKVQVATDSNFANIVIQSSNLTDTSLTLGQLIPLTQYFWKVEASNEGGSTESMKYKFTTLGTATLSLTLPIGGENWQVGTKHNITWKSTFITSVRIEYSIDSAKTWSTIAASVLASQSTYLWTIPNTVSTKCKVRVSDITSGGISSTSENLFTIFTPTLALTSPAGGELWRSGTQHNITWTSGYISTIKIEYTVDDALNWITITNGTPAVSGSFAWTTPLLTSTNCLVRISDSANVSQASVSNSTFTIYTPQLTLTTPIGGESWQTGTSHDITWTSSYMASLKIVYSTDSGTNWTFVASGVPAASGKYSWTVPHTASTTCKVKISNEEDSSFTSMSSGLFTLYAPTLALTAPSGGEYWQADSIYNVVWTSTFVSRVKIEYSTDTGTLWMVIAASTPAEAHSFAWKVPNTPSKNCLVRISDDADTGLFAISKKVFTIYRPSITIAAPAGGENWKAGTLQNIQWTSNDVSTVKIEFTSNNGTNWSTIAASLSASAGTLSWTVPKVTSTLCRVRIMDALHNAVRDSSRQVFSIYTPAISIMSPKGGEKLIVGTSKTIEWISSFITNMKIEVTTDNGSSWKTLVTTIPASVGSYPWFIQLKDSASACRLRLSDVDDPTAYTISDSAFSVKAIPPSLQMSVFQNAALSQYCNVVVITDSLLSGRPIIKVWQDTDTTLVSAEPLTNSAFAYTGEFKLGSSGTYNVYSKLTSLMGATHDTVRTLGILAVQPENGGSMASADKKAVLTIPAGSVKGPVYFILSQNIIAEETVYEIGPASYSGRPLQLELVYDTKEIKDASRLFIYEYTSGSWKALRSQVNTKTGTIKAYIGSLGKFKLGIDASFSGSNIIPEVFALKQNYPNPFNPTTMIAYDLPEDGIVSLQIYDILGRRVKTLYDDFALAGSYSVKWNGSGEDNRPLATGIYLCRLQTGKAVAIKKLMLIK